jgi:phosphate-selective porin OprO/OprP
MHKHMACLVGLAWLGVALGAGAQGEPKEIQLKVIWDDTLKFVAPDGNYVRIDGRIMADAGFFIDDEELKRSFDDPDDASDDTDFEDASEMRRVRLGIGGMLHQNINFRLDYELSGGDLDARDVFIGIRDLPYVGLLRVGHQREPMSLVQQSSKYRPMMESPLAWTFSPERNTGIRATKLGFDKRLNGSYGVFRETDTTGTSVGKDDYHLTARVAGLPYLDEENDRRVHLGLAYSHQEATDDAVRYRARPESHLAPQLVDTGSIPADDIGVLGLEAAAQCGPYTLVAEYLQSSIDSIDGSAPVLDGYYLMAGYILTGETREYSSRDAGFRGIRPDKNFGDGNWGAAEVVAQISQLDLNDKAVSGGELTTYSAGFNWYLNVNTRVMLSYVYADLEDVDQMHILQTRFQVHF